MSNTGSKPGRRPVIAHPIRTLALPILLLGLLLTVGLSMITPPLGEVADEHSVPITPQDAPAFKSMMRIGKVFKEFDSDSSAMVALAGQDKLGDSAHYFYNHIVAKLRADKAHVEHVQDFWSDPLTAAGSQSVDGKGAYVQVFFGRCAGHDT
jgi:putative drug exporter of the RND superfamily